MQWLWFRVAKLLSGLLQRKRFIKKVFQRWFCHTFFDCPLAKLPTLLAAPSFLTMVSESIGTSCWAQSRAKSCSSSSLSPSTTATSSSSSSAGRVITLGTFEICGFSNLARKYSLRAKIDVFSAQYRVDTASDWHSGNVREFDWLLWSAA